jgi:transcriptional regulator with XRE-family HTH domain
MMKVQQILHFRGLSQREIAEKLNMSEGYFSQLCRGRRTPPFHILTPLAALLETQVEDVVNAFQQVAKHNARFF